MADVDPFFVVTSSSQLPPQIDPRCLVDIDLASSLDPEPVFSAFGSGIYIGGGIILTAGHVTHDIESASPAVLPDSLFNFTFGSGLSNVSDVSMAISTSDPAERRVDGRDRFQSFATHQTGADVAMIDLSQGGPIGAEESGYLNSLRATPMAIFANPEDTFGTQVSVFGYPAETLDGSTLCQANGEITGFGAALMSSSGLTLQAFAAAVSLESGFSGGPVLASLTFEGSGTQTYLLGLVSASFGAFDGLFAPMLTIYHLLAESLEPFHSASEFARNALVSDQSQGGVLVGTFFHEDCYGGDFRDSISAAGGNDEVRAGAERDAIFGGTGSDTVFGGAGGDRIADGAGVDIVFAEGGDDRISVSGAASANFYHGGLGDDTLSYRGIVDRLTINLVAGTVTGLTGREDGLRAIENIEGAQGRDTISGNDLDNHLDGRQGNDLLQGGLGADTFVMSATLDANANVDLIGDFEHLTDQISLTAAEFSVLGAAVGRSELCFGTVAADGDDWLVYDRATGRLYLDGDGGGALEQVLFARLTAGTVLTAADFII